VFRSEVITGWKDIATYLGRGVRTVQRYDRAFCLPVRRNSGKSAGSVLATKTELDTWTAVAPLREVFRLSPGSVDKNAIDKTCLERVEPSSRGAESPSSGKRRIARSPARISGVAARQLFWPYERGSSEHRVEAV